MSEKIFFTTIIMSLFFVLLGAAIDMPRGKGVEQSYFVGASVVCMLTALLTFVAHIWGAV